MPAANDGSSSEGKRLSQRLWGGYSLRPAPCALNEYYTPQRGGVRMRRSGKSTYLFIFLSKTFFKENDPDDALLLRTIEAYDASSTHTTRPLSRTQHATNAAVLLPEDEKMFIEEYTDGRLVMQEKYALT